MISLISSRHYSANTKKRKLSVLKQFVKWFNLKEFNKLMNISLKAHNLLGCRGVTRSDFKYYKKKFYLLEINTQPGMTKLSLVPEISAYRGISFINLINLILKDAATNK